MRTTIELPESIYRKGEKIASTQGVTIEELIIQTFERELSERELKAAPDVVSQSKRVTLPLVSSREPGTLDLNGFNFDDLLT